MPFDDEPEDRFDVRDAMLGIRLALLVAPGLIWWIGVFIGVFSETVLGVAR